jgi:hypothetical protein
MNPLTVQGGFNERREGAGRVLCHNHIRHTVDMPCGENGFRAWTDLTPPPNFVKCPCGYAGLPHYARRDHVKAVRTLARGERA